MISFRTATLSDAANIAEMVKTLLIELGDEKEATEFLSADTVSALMQNGKTSVLLAESESSKGVGLLTLSEAQAIYAGGLYGIIDEMYEAPEYRSQNVGAQLINQAKELAKEKGWKRLAVTAPPDNNARPMNFYRQNGFELAGPKLKVKTEP